MSNPSTIAICNQKGGPRISIHSNIAFLTNSNAISTFILISGGFRQFIKCIGKEMPWMHAFCNV